MIDLHDPEALEAHCLEQRVDPQHGARLVRLVLRYGWPLELALGKLRGPVPAAWANELGESSLRLLEVVDSDIDGATKSLYETPTGQRIESVLLRIASGRCALCLSIQSHCPVACSFCSSGAPGKPARLELRHVLEQVTRARQLLREEGHDLRNVVFMGMGEPLLEEPLLHAALANLIDPRTYAFSAGRLMVSTVGLPDEMLRLARAFPGVRQALSLHSAKQAVRESLIPFAKRFHLDELRATVREIGRLTGGQVFVEYLLLEGVNDGPEDEAALAAWLTDLPVKLNLIPYNAPQNLPAGHSVDLDLRPTPRLAREAFARRMRALGVPTTLRRSLGADISAACGQLAVRST